MATPEISSLAPGLLSRVKQMFASAPNQLPAQGSPIPDFLANHKKEIFSALGGAGLGAGLMGASSTGANPDETPEEHKAKLRKNMLLGAVLGGAGGLGAGHLWNVNTPPPPGPPGPGDIAWNVATRPTSMGAGGAMLANMGAKKYVANKSLNGEKVQDIKKSLHDLITKSIDPASKQNQKLGDPAITQMLEAKVRQLVGADTHLGRWSQNKFVRGAGLSAAPGGGEQAVVDALRSIRDVHNVNGTTIDPVGQRTLDKILGGYAGGKGTGHMPILREAVEHRGTGASPLSNANTRSAGGRVITGLTGTMLARKLIEHMRGSGVQQTSVQ